MIQNLTLGNSFSENIISNIQLFKICPQVPVDIIRIFFNFQILQISQTQQKLVKKITHFTTVSLEKPHSCYKPQLNSADTENNMLVKHSQNPFPLYKFSSEHFPV